MIILTTKRLWLRHFHIHDGDSLLRVFGDAEVMRFGEGVQTREWVDNWLRTCLESYQLRGFGPYALVEQKSGEVIGYCGLFYFSDVHGKPEIELGYRLVRSAWGQGYATEAASAVRDFAFDILNIKRLIALIDPSNEASIRVAKKIRMRREGEVMLEGYSHPDHIYMIAADNRFS